MNRIIDAHIHLTVTPWAQHKGFFPEVPLARTYLESSGIGGAHFNTWQGVLGERSEDVMTANRDALMLYGQMSEFFHPGLIVHPAFPDESLSGARQFAEQGLIWIGELVPRQKFDRFDHPDYLKIFEHCIELGFKVLQLHNTPGIATVARCFPELKVVVSHITEPLEELAACPNVWLDISGFAGGVVMGALTRAKELFGAGRLLFGSDFDGYDPKVFIFRVQDTFNVDEQEAIFYRNFWKVNGDK